MKKIEIWILYLVILLGLIASIFFGFLVRQETIGGTKNIFTKAALAVAEIPLTTIKIFRSFSGLIPLDDRFPNLDGFDGETNEFQAYLLLTKYDGSLKEGVVELIDLTNFEILHTWNPDIDFFNSETMSFGDPNEFKYLQRDSNNKRSRLKHPQLTNDGGLLFINQYSPLYKIDSCSNLMFQNAENLYHHSIEVDEKNNIWAPSYLFPSELNIRKFGEKIYSDGGYYDDAIVKLSPQGKILFSKSISEIFLENNMEYLLFSVGDPGFDRDPIHLNDIQPVDFSSRFWQKGDVFISLRHQSMILLYRPATNKIIWTGVGPFYHQHDIDILDDHRISIFNNNSKDFWDKDTVDVSNEVLIYDFAENKYSSYFKESLLNNNIKTLTQGRSQILPNGDLFIEETDYGRSLFFNSDGSLRWTHLNRSDDGKVYTVGWSRIMYSSKDLQKVNNFLNNKGECND